jgi:hypothetical protein
MDIFNCNSIEEIRSQIDKIDGNPEIVEAVYRKMISCFIKEELKQHFLIINKASN